MAECAVYAEALLPKKHGFPFWFTEPHINLPEDYRASGVQIGDVLLFTNDGGYDFMFNMFLSKDHPINVGRVPPDFQPLPFDPASNVVRRDNWKNPGTYISNLTAKKLSVNGSASAVIPGIPSEFGAGFEFTISNSSGGILVLPEGAARADFNSHDLLRKYIDEHIHAWFEHINGTESGFARGSDHLYIVTGCDKSTESAVASFSSLSDGQDVSLRFIAASISIGVSYSWANQSSADTRITPVDLSGDHKNRNHCAFARGFTYTRSLRSGRRGFRVKVSDLSTAKPWRSDVKSTGWDPKSWWPSRSSRTSSSSSKKSPPKSPPPTSTCSSGVPPFTQATICEDLTTLGRSVLHDSSADTFPSNWDEESECEGIDFGYPRNPSEVINESMLAVDEEADYFVTHDDDWCSLEFEDPMQLFERDALLEAVTSRPLRDTPNNTLVGIINVQASQDTTESPQVSEPAAQPDAGYNMHPLLEQPASVPTMSTESSKRDLTPLSISIPGVEKRKALLIGISYKNQQGHMELKGPHDDVRGMRQLLIDRYGYKEWDIVILTDEEATPKHLQPTYANILHQSQLLVHDARAGDRFFFHYAGHTDQVENGDHTEEDGMDECIIPTDSINILDNDLRRYLVNPLPVGSHLVAIFDSCHSESLLDQLHFKCNRVYVPWMSKGKWKTDPYHNRVVRRDGMAESEVHPLDSTLRTVYQSKRTSSSSLASRKTSMVAEPSEPPSSKSPGFQKSRPLSVRTHFGEWNESEELPFEMTRCESPTAEFPCDGWCLPSTTTNDKANVISLALCKDSQQAWESTTGESMTQALIKILDKDPHPRLRDLMTNISHAVYKQACSFHARSVKYKKEWKAWKARHPESEAERLPAETDNFPTPMLASDRPLNMSDTFNM